MKNSGLSKFGLRERRRFGPWLCKLLVLVCATYMVFVWLAYRQAEISLAHRHSIGQVFKPQFKQNRLQLFEKECRVWHRAQHGHVSGPLNTEIAMMLKPGMCHALDAPMHSDIQMESEWSSISVGYPQYVYTVSGWIQVLDVPNYTPRPLKVIIVPHSHQDPGWKDTFEGYYLSKTRAILDNVMKFLTERPQWTFIWSEISLLEKWYNEVSDVKKEQLKKNSSLLICRLVKRGQLELVTAGWVMTDEAVTHYGAMLDQLMEGQLWVKDNLGVTPNVSWSVDPFGHSPTMTYLLKKSGIDHMVIQRVHFGVKKHLALRKNLEFVWRQAWDPRGDTGMFCHMMPFLLYAIQYSCGPDPHVCCQFDFHRDKCFRGTEVIPRVLVDDSNIRKLSWALWEQLQKKAQLYRSNVVLVPHGDVFRYRDTEEWADQLGNLGQLMDYMNKDPDMNIQMEFGTLTDYFKEVTKDTTQYKTRFPSLTGDFFPYNDRDDQYWTGYYTSRPMVKLMGRNLQAKLRMTEILFTLLCARYDGKIRQSLYNKSSILTSVRRTLALFQHHCAITGTGSKYIMSDYANRLQNSIKEVDNLQQVLMLTSVSGRLNWTSVSSGTSYMSEEWTHNKVVPLMKVIEWAGHWYVLVSNTMTVAWRSAVKVRTLKAYEVTSLSGQHVPYQVNPAIGTDLNPILGQFDIVFEASLAPLSVKVFVMREVPLPVFAKVTIYGELLNMTNFHKSFHVTTSVNEMFEIENDILRATFSFCTGTLQYTHHKLDDIFHQMSIQLVKYGTGSWTNPFKDKSGAYIFMPDGPAKDLVMFYPSILVLEGPVMSSVTSQLLGVLHTATLYNISGAVSSGVHLHNVVSLTSGQWDNTELAMRVKTDVVSPDNAICVDLNGFQMHRKRWRSKLLIQGNFHPMTSATFIEDDRQSRVSLLTSQPHGVASLNQGWLEVILDRRLMQDDWRGLDEGSSDNVATPSHFILLPERRDTPGKHIKGPACYPSLLAHRLSTHMSNQPQIAIFKGNNHTHLQPETTLLKQGWPESYHLVTLRYRPSTTEVNALLILHKVGLDCNFSQVYFNCDMEKIVRLNTFMETNLKSAVETSLTGTKEFKYLGNVYAAVELDEMDIQTYRLTFR